jgi:hypothetical protein
MPTQNLNVLSLLILMINEGKYYFIFWKFGLIRICEVNIYTAWRNNLYFLVISLRFTVTGGNDGSLP